MPRRSCSAAIRASTAPSPSATADAARPGVATRPRSKTRTMPAHRSFMRGPRDGERGVVTPRLFFNASSSDSLRRFEPLARTRGRGASLRRLEPLGHQRRIDRQDLAEPVELGLLGRGDEVVGDDDQIGDAQQGARLLVVAGKALDLGMEDLGGGSGILLDAVDVVVEHLVDLGAVEQLYQVETVEDVVDAIAGGEADLGVG